MCFREWGHYDERRVSMASTAGLRWERRPGRTACQEYIGSPAWRRQRQIALASAGGRCQVCNSPDDLDVHHRTYERFGAEWPGDLTVLCATCHQLYHGRVAAGDEERVDPWERLLAWCVTELQSGLSEAINRLSWDLPVTGRGKSTLGYAQLVDSKVRRKLAAFQEAERRKRGIYLVKPTEPR